MASQIDSTMTSVSELLESFDLNEIQSIVEAQIVNPRFDMLGDSSVDQFTPIVNAFTEAINRATDEDDIKLLSSRLQNVCELFLEAIQDRYAICLEDGKRESEDTDMVEIVTNLYTVFVLNNLMIVEDVLYAYIVKNRENIITTFEDGKNRKDASSSAKRRYYNIDDAVIMAQIYDIGAWILENMSVDEFFEYSEQDEEHLAYIHDMYEKGYFTGLTEGDPPVESDFVDRLADRYKSDVTYKGTLCTNLLERLSSVFPHEGEVPSDPQSEIKAFTKTEEEIQEAANQAAALQAENSPTE